MILPLIASSSYASGQIPIGRSPQNSGQHQVSVRQLVDLLTAEARQVVAETNEMLQRTSSSVRVELGTNFVPEVFAESKQTVFPDRPNQPYVSLIINFPVNLKVPGVQLSESRSIGLVLDFSCDGWQIGNGSLRVDVEPHTCPSFENNGFPRNSFQNIPEYMQGRFEQRASAALANDTALKARCGSISFSSQPSGKPRPLPTFINLNPPPISRAIIGVTPSRETLQITFLTLKRLPAHELTSNVVIYKPVENILVETYANFIPRELGIFSMKEGDTVNLNLPPLAIDTPLFGRLTMLLNVFQLPDGAISDSASEDYVREKNYSPGVHTITVEKTDPSRKNHYGSGRPAYELTFSVNYTNPRGQVNSQKVGARP